jgi:hypothetical protein
MESAPGPSKHLEFDLTELAIESERASRGRRLLTQFFAIVFGAAALIGVYLIVFPPVGHSSTFYTGPALLVFLGLVILVSALWVARGMGRTPRKLVLDSQHIVFKDAPGRPDLCLAWNDPRLRLTLYDGRNLSGVSRGGRPRLIRFVVEPRSGVQTPVPLSAFEAILANANDHRLRVDHSPASSANRDSLQVLVIRSTS